jgi:mannose PTS system EIIC component
MGTAIFLELFWLDFFPAGTFIPPQSLLSLFLVLTTATLLGVESPQEIALLLAAALPMGWLGSRLEWFQRSLQDSTYNIVINSARSGSGYAPGKLVQRSLVHTLVLSFLLFLAAQTLFFFAFRLYFQAMGGTVRSIPLDWPHLWVLASLGPLLSLRHRLPYLYLLAALVIAGAALWLLTAWPLKSFLP